MPGVEAAGTLPRATSCTPTNGQAARRRGDPAPVGGGGIHQTIDWAIDRAVNFLRRVQLPSGELPTVVSTDASLANACRPDSVTTTTALALHSLGFCDHPAVPAMLCRGRAFLLGELMEPGIWRFWTAWAGGEIDPDVDDTCLASLALRAYHPAIRSGANHYALLLNRDPHGRFRTWLRLPSARNDVDSVVNANVLAYLGEHRGTLAVCDYLNGLVVEDVESGSHRYYPDDLALYYAISRAFSSGVRRLGRSRDPILTKVAARQLDDGSFGDPLGTANALCTWLNLEGGERAARAAAVRALLAAQGSDGAWPRVAAWAGPEAPAPLSLFWGSEALTTSLCIEALARYRALADVSREVR